MLQIAILFYILVTKYTIWRYFWRQHFWMIKTVYTVLSLEWRNSKAPWQEAANLDIKKHWNQLLHKQILISYWQTTLTVHCYIIIHLCWYGLYTVCCNIIKIAVQLTSYNRSPLRVWTLNDYSRIHNGIRFFLINKEKIVLLQLQWKRILKHRYILRNFIKKLCQCSTIHLMLPQQ